MDQHWQSGSTNLEYKLECTSIDTYFIICLTGMLSAVSSISIW